jgi:hypothetical protein
MRSSVHIASKRHRQIHGPTQYSEEGRKNSLSACCHQEWKKGKYRGKYELELTLFPPNAAPISAPLVPTLTYAKKK